MLNVMHKWKHIHYYTLVIFSIFALVSSFSLKPFVFNKVTFL